jgi:hypothetical protein
MKNSEVLIFHFKTNKRKCYQMLLRLGYMITALPESNENVLFFSPMSIYGTCTNSQLGRYIVTALATGQGCGLVVVRWKSSLKPKMDILIRQQRK